MVEYSQILKEILKEAPKDENVLDIGKEEEIMLVNL